MDPLCWPFILKPFFARGQRVESSMYQRIANTAPINLLGNYSRSALVRSSFERKSRNIEGLLPTDSDLPFFSSGIRKALMV